MGKIVISIPFAVIVSVVLVSVGAALASNGPGIGTAALGAAVFASILYTGAAIRHRQRSR